MADDGTIVALRGRSFVRLRPDGAAIGMPLDAIGGDWVVSGGPYDARVAPDGLRIAYWFTGPAALLPADSSRVARSRTPTSPPTRTPDRVTDPLELGVVRERRQPSWYGAGRALVFRHGAGTGETVSVNRVGRGEADDQGWFSYDDGTSLEQGQLDHGGDPARGGGGREPDPPVRRQPAAARAAGAALRRARRAVRVADLVARRHDARLGAGRRRARRRPGARPAPARARLLGDRPAAADRRHRPVLGRAPTCRARPSGPPPPGKPVARKPAQARSARCGWRSASAAARCGCGCGSPAGRRASTRACSTAARAPAASLRRRARRGRCACASRSTAAAKRALARSGRLTLRLRADRARARAGRPRRLVRRVVVRPA